MRGPPITPLPAHLADIADDEARALLDAALVLQTAAAEGRRLPLLRDRNFGLLCGPAQEEATQQLFRTAVEELGGRVSRVRPPPAEASSLDIRNTARVLGHLYDGLECLGMDAATVRQLARDAGVPVYDGLATDMHPTAGLARRIEGHATPDQKRRFIVQAVLLGTVQ
jgi:ornithine carbamoyltransferase